MVIDLMNLKMQKLLAIILFVFQLPHINKNNLIFIEKNLKKIILTYS